LPNISSFIYIVDDDPSVAKALRRLLHSWGMQVRTFASGEELLSALSRSHEMDCLVIDVQMPGMTGLEVLERMKRSGKNLPVIFITAYEEEGMEEKAMRAGAIGFLRKPLPEKDLINLIAKAMQSKGSMQGEL
jgi:FixJ family two-component response regulator